MPSAPVSFVKLSIEFWNLTLFNCYAKEAEKFPQENVRQQNLRGHKRKCGHEERFYRDAGAGDSTRRPLLQT